MRIYILNICGSIGGNTSNLKSRFFASWQFSCLVLAQNWKNTVPKNISTTVLSFKSTKISQAMRAIQLHLQ
jgi:hypothetical protein